MLPFGEFQTVYKIDLYDLPPCRCKELYDRLKPWNSPETIRKKIINCKKAYSNDRAARRRKYRKDKETQFEQDRHRKRVAERVIRQPETIEPPRPIAERLKPDALKLYNEGVKKQERALSKKYREHEEAKQREEEEEAERQVLEAEEENRVRRRIQQLDRAAEAMRTPQRPLARRYSRRDLRRTYWKP